MSHILVNNSLTKLGFQKSVVQSSNRVEPFLRFKAPKFKPQRSDTQQNSLLGGSGVPNSSKSKGKNTDKLDKFLRQSPALHKLYSDMKPTMTQMAPFANAIRDKKITIPFKNDKSKSITLGHVGTYKNYAEGERDTLKRMGVKVAPKSSKL
tara:strand:+ start:145 stop:597 length:453 start_codon:yes stop_codon:yes gene_type:complete